MAKLSVFQSAIHTPQDISRLEKQTGMKAVISGHGIKLVDFTCIDDYELVARQSYLSSQGKFAGDTA